MVILLLKFYFSRLTPLFKLGLLPTETHFNISPKINALHPRNPFFLENKQINTYWRGPWSVSPRSIFTWPRLSLLPVTVFCLLPHQWTFGVIQPSPLSPLCPAVIGLRPRLLFILKLTTATPSCLSNPACSWGLHAIWKFGNLASFAVSTKYPMTTWFCVTGKLTSAHDMLCLFADG